MKVILAEKPSVAREIAAIVGASEKQDGYLLGNDYAVTWALGHLVQLALPEAYGCARIPQRTPTYSTSSLCAGTQANPWR